MKLFIFAISVIGAMSFNNFAYSQYEENVNYHIQITEGMAKAQEGTYQFIVNPKFNPVFTDDILYFIEENRRQDEDVTISIMYCADLYIPSRNKINASDFTPLAFIVH